MSYSCLRSPADERYHALCRHDCCGDDACEERRGRWWGQAHYPNGCKVISELSGIYTEDDLDFLRRLNLPMPTRVYSAPGAYMATLKAPIPAAVTQAAQGSARPTRFLLCLLLSHVIGVIGVIVSP